MRASAVGAFLSYSYKSAPEKASRQWGRRDSTTDISPYSWKPPAKEPNGGPASNNQSTLLALEQQAQSFASLPTGTAGTRVTDDSFNYPLSLLQARLNALQNEVNSFTSVSGRLLDILSNETALIDELLAADSLKQWVASQPQLEGAWSTSWSFSTGLGPESPALPPIDPSNQVEYDADLTTLNVLDCTTDTPVFTSGLRPPVTPTQFSTQNAVWSYPSGGIAQPLYAPDMSWAQLGPLEKRGPAPLSAPFAGFSIRELLPRPVTRL